MEAANVLSLPVIVDTMVSILAAAELLLVVTVP